MPRGKQEMVAGDRGFTGMHNRIDPGSLAAGEVADAENIRFRHGVAETRPGVHKPASFNNIAPELSDEINPWTTIHGASTFRDTNGTEHVIMAADGKAHRMRQGNNPIELTMPTGLTLDDDVQFTQAFGKLLMHRGKLIKPLVMSTLDAGFADVIDVYDDTATYAAGDRICWGPELSPSGITRSGTTVTVTFAADHGYLTGQEIFVRGANETGYSGRWKITVGDDDKEFTYTVSTTPATPATGTLKTATHFDFYEANASPNTPVAGEDPINDSAKWTQKFDAMPNSNQGVYIQNRLAVPTAYNFTLGGYDKKVDTVVFSDILDITKTYYDQGFEVDQGDRQEIVDIHIISENQLAIFKNNSVHIFSGVKVEATNTTFATNVTLETLIPHYGLAAPRAVATAGDDIYFFSSKRGVVSFKRNLEGKVYGVDLPLTEPIQKLMQRVDSRNYDKVRMEYWDNALYVAVPLDGGDSGENNCLLVWDFLTKSWSYYTGTAIRPKEFFIAQWSGRERLFFWGGDGFVNLVDEGWATDDIRDTGKSNNIGGEDIAFKLTTRGYTSEDLDHHKFQTLRVSLGTWNPQYDIKLLPDGVNEGVAIVTDRTKDRTKYYRPFDAADFDEVTDTDFDTAQREDYSCRVGDSSGSYLGMTLGDGFYPFRHQEILESYPMPIRQGRYGQVEITGDQGRLEVKEITLTSTGGDRATVVHS